jgi:hypothetical protein
MHGCNSWVVTVASIGMMAVKNSMMKISKGIGSNARQFTKTQ